MKERPILFNSEMVNAILSGRKTQTRRIMKVQPENPHLGLRRIIESKKSSENGKYFWSQSDACGTKPRSKTFSCPLGQPGDQLWVRECFSDLVSFGFFDGAVPDFVPDYWYWADGNPKWGDWTKPKSSIHMPRAASRVNLIITGVRVERLNDISEQDAMAEGITAKDVIIETRYEGGGHVEITAERFFFVGGDDEGYESAEEAFAELWDSIYGQKEGENWQANPWVWVINFELIKGGEK